MGKWNLVGPSYTSQSLNADCQRTVNLYPEVVESGTGNSNIVLYPSPGTKQFADLTPVVPPPVEYLNPDIYNTITIPRSGINSGNSFLLNSFVSGPPIQIGDTLFIAFYMLLVPNTNTISGVNLTYLGTSLGTFTQVGPTVTFSSGLSHGALVLFACQAAISVPLEGAILGTFTFTGPSADSDYVINWTCIRNLTTLDQVSSQAFTGVSSFSAPALTIAQDEFVFAYLKPSIGNGASVNAEAPFIKYTSNSGGCAAGNRNTDGFFKVPAGTYSPIFDSTVGPMDAAIINASYKLVIA